MLRPPPCLPRLPSGSRPLGGSRNVHQRAGDGLGASGWACSRGAALSRAAPRLEQSGVTQPPRGGRGAAIPRRTSHVSLASSDPSGLPGEPGKWGCSSLTDADGGARRTDGSSIRPECVDGKLRPSSRSVGREPPACDDSVQKRGHISRRMVPGTSLASIGTFGRCWSRLLGVPIRGSAESKAVGARSVGGTRRRGNRIEETWASCGARLARFFLETVVRGVRAAGVEWHLPVLVARRIGDDAG